MTQTPDTLTRVDLDALLVRARQASRTLARLDRNAALCAIAEALTANQAAIISQNALDVASERNKGTSESLIDRLTLTEARLDAMAQSLHQLAALPDPLGRVQQGWRLDNGLDIKKVSVPFGVIGMIYESRPNVTVDAAALALKAGSSAVLRGSANALHSNRILVQVMRDALTQKGAPADAILLIDSPDRQYVTELLEARGKVDLVIPRGGASLIQHVVENAKVPVIETGSGNCHIFVDASANLDKAHNIVINAKTQRPGVCNAIETLLVHQNIAEDFLPELLAEMQRDFNVEIIGCERTHDIYPKALTATEQDWQTEYLDYKLAVRVVDNLDVAIEHINTYGSQHSEAILTRDMGHAQRFQEEVDAAAVYVNASTRFTDGFEMGFGAEIGISTQKLHARGPMGLEEITTYKYLITGTGQVRT